MSKIEPNRQEETTVMIYTCDKNSIISNPVGYKMILEHALSVRASSVKLAQTKQRPNRYFIYLINCSEWEDSLVTPHWAYHWVPGSSAVTGLITVA